METRDPVKRRPGRAPGIHTERYQVLLEPEVAEWAKRQPGGLSGLLRQLLRQAYETDSDC